MRYVSRVQSRTRSHSSNFPQAVEESGDPEIAEHVLHTETPHSEVHSNVHTNHGSIPASR